MIYLINGLYKEVVVEDVLDYLGNIDNSNTDKKTAMLDYCFEVLKILEENNIRDIPDLKIELSKGK